MRLKGKLTDKCIVGTIINCILLLSCEKSFEKAGGNVHIVDTLISSEAHAERLIAAAPLTLIQCSIKDIDTKGCGEIVNCRVNALRWR